MKVPELYTRFFAFGMFNVRSNNAAFSAAATPKTARVTNLQSLKWPVLTYVNNSGMSGTTK